MQLVDTHCHIHQPEFYDAGKSDEVYARARQDNIGMVLASTSVESSRRAIEFGRSHEGSFALVGIHPHDTEPEDISEIAHLLREHRQDIMGIGEIGLDYFYQNSPRQSQIAALEQQLQWAHDYSLPVSFHVRDDATDRGAVWRDFWPIFDNFHSLSGVLHSFTDTQANLDAALGRGLYIGVNGISTFTKDAAQQQMYANLPLEHMLLETDAPFLTPSPLRGKMNEPSFVGRVAEHMADVRHVPLSLVSDTTTANARRLFSI